MKIRLSASISTTDAEDDPTLAVLESESERALDYKLLTGLAWTGGAKWAVQALSWASTLIIARILTPGDFGLMGMALVYLGLVQLVNEFGLTAAILRNRALTEDQIARLGGFGIAMGAGFCLLSIAAAAPIARFYGEPAVRTIIMILSLNFLFTAIGVLPRALMARDLDFRRLSWIDALSSLAQTLLTILLAVLGFRYMSLVFGSLVASLTGAVLALVMHRHRVAFPRDFRSLTQSLLMGWHVVVGRIGWYTYQNADFAVVGRVLGKAILGAYTLGWEIATLPVERISALVGQVTPGIFSSVAHDPPALRRYYLAIVEGLAFLTFPASVGIAITAPLMVPVLLGPNWSNAVLPLQLLAFYGGMRSINTVTAQVLIYSGYSRESMWYSVLAAVVLPLLFVFATRWGAPGVAGTWIIAYPILLIPVHRLIFRILDLPLSGYLRVLWPALSSSAVMAAAVLAVQRVAAGAVSPHLVLLLEVATGVAVYAGMMLALHRSRIDAFVALVRGARGAASGAAA